MTEGAASSGAACESFFSGEIERVTPFHRMCSSSLSRRLFMSHRAVLGADSLGDGFGDGFGFRFGLLLLVLVVLLRLGRRLSFFLDNLLRGLWRLFRRSICRRRFGRGFRSSLGIGPDTATYP